jgi:hypothetical protein
VTHRRDDTPLSILNRVFGFDRFRGAQAEIIDLVIGGGDALVLMPTGGGKSLCYQIPALLRPGTGIVVSPLIALMQDQVDALTQHGVRADSCLCSSRRGGQAARCLPSPSLISRWILAESDSSRPGGARFHDRCNTDRRLVLDQPCCSNARRSPIAALAREI